MRRVAVVASHPIQYQAPWFRGLAEVCDLTVWFCHQQSAAEQGRAGFGQAFEWDVPLADGYRSLWLKNVSSRPGVDRRAGCDTPEIRERLARGSFEACVVNGWYLKSYQQAISACRALGIPVLVRGDSHLKVRRSALTSAVKYFPYRWMLGRIDAHLYVGQANADYLRHYGVRPARMFFAPHFVDNDRFAAAAAKARRDGAASALRHTWGASEKDTLFQFVGKLIDLKRVQDFVVAVARASRQDPAIKGVVVGSGPEEPALRRLAVRERAPVTFAGFMNQTELPTGYAAADCLVLPSATESWGLVVNEAMATGMPAIVSNRVGAGPDLIVEGVTGHTYPAGDFDELAKRLLRVRRSFAGSCEGFRAAVLERIGRYTCGQAVAGTLRAIDATSRAVARTPAVVESKHA